MDSHNNFLTVVYGSGVYKAVDNTPTNWVIKTNGLYTNYLTSIATSKFPTTFDHIYLSDENNIYKTTNVGETWISITTPCYFGIKNICINDSGYIFINTSCGIFRSTDDGNNWSLMNYNNWNGNITSITASPFHNSIYVSAENGFYRTTDNGNNWYETSMSGSYAFKMEINSKGHLYILNPFSEILKSTDNGNTFEVVNNGLPSTSGFMIDLAFNSEGHIYLASKNGLYVSRNDAASWELVDESLTSKLINVIEFDDEDRLYAGLKNNGVYRSISITTVIDNKNNIIGSFTLSQNYPNPFNPNTKISYSVASLSNVSLKVYDILGREVVTLINEEKPAGNYEVNLNASNLASGVYFYQLKAGDFIQSKKMILIK